MDQKMAFYINISHSSTLIIHMV